MVETNGKNALHLSRAACILLNAHIFLSPLLAGISLPYVAAYLVLFVLVAHFSDQLLQQGYGWYCALFYLGVLLFAVWPESLSENDGTALLAQVLFVGLVVCTLAVTKKNLFAYALTATVYLIAVILVPLLFIVYAASSGARFGAEQIHAMLQTDTAEALAYLHIFVGGLPLAGGVATTSGAVLLLGTALQRGKPLCFNPALALGLGVAIIAFLSSPAQPPYMKHFLQGLRQYSALLAEQRNLSEFRTRHPTAIDASKREDDETHVLVIGESANRHHLAHYGYFRDTDTPLQATPKLLWFDDAISPHTHTNLSLQFVLTAAQVADAGTDRYASSPSIVEVANAAGVDTYWFSNQSSLGGWDNNVAIIAKQARHVRFMNHSVGRVIKTSVYDEALIEPFVEALNSPTKHSKFIVLHLMGSHWPYCERYPKAFEIYQSTNTPIRPGASEDVRLSCYDNSMAYTSHIVARIIRAVEEHGGISSLIYLSDHSEDVLGRRGHDSARFTPTMVEIPMLAWVSRAYSSRYPTKAAALRANQTMPFMSDDLFHVSIDMMNIRTSLERPEHSLASLAYEPGMRKTLGGRVDYDTRKASESMLSGR